MLEKSSALHWHCISKVPKLSDQGRGGLALGRLVAVSAKIHLVGTEDLIDVKPPVLTPLIHNHKVFVVLYSSSMSSSCYSRTGRQRNEPMMRQGAFLILSGLEFWFSTRRGGGEDHASVAVGADGHIRLSLRIACRPTGKVGTVQRSVIVVGTCTSR
jgi:hypothetical protein